jgi:hypothetical protein
MAATSYKPWYAREGLPTTLQHPPADGVAVGRVAVGVAVRVGLIVGVAVGGVPVLVEVAVGGVPVTLGVGVAVGS